MPLDARPYRTHHYISIVGLAGRDLGDPRPWVAGSGWAASVARTYVNGPGAVRSLPAHSARGSAGAPRAHPPTARQPMTQHPGQPRWEREEARDGRRSSAVGCVLFLGRELRDLSAQSDGTTLATARVRAGKGTGVHRQASEQGRPGSGDGRKMKPSDQPRNARGMVAGWRRSHQFTAGLSRATVSSLSLLILLLL